MPITARDVLFFIGGLLPGIFIGGRISSWMIKRVFLKHTGIELEKAIEWGGFHRK